MTLNDTLARPASSQAFANLYNYTVNVESDILVRKMFFLFFVRDMPI